MQGERIPKSLSQSSGLGCNIFQAGCGSHVETPPKVRVAADTNMINSLNFCTPAPRAPNGGRRIELRPWELRCLRSALQPSCPGSPSLWLKRAGYM